MKYGNSFTIGLVLKEHQSRWEMRKKLFSKTIVMPVQPYLLYYFLSETIG